MYLDCKLDCESTDAGKVLMQISNRNTIKMASDKFQAWIFIHPKESMNILKLFKAILRLIYYTDLILKLQMT